MRVIQLVLFSVRESVYNLEKLIEKLERRVYTLIISNMTDYIHRLSKK